MVAEAGIPERLNIFCEKSGFNAVELKVVVIGNQQILLLIKESDLFRFVSGFPVFIGSVVIGVLIDVDLGLLLMSIGPFRNFKPFVFIYCHVRPPPLYTIHTVYRGMKQDFSS